MDLGAMGLGAMDLIAMDLSAIDLDAMDLDAIDLGVRCARAISGAVAFCCVPRPTFADAAGRPCAMASTPKLPFAGTDPHALQTTRRHGFHRRSTPT